MNARVMLSVVCVAFCGLTFAGCETMFVEKSSKPRYTVNGMAAPVVSEGKIYALTCMNKDRPVDSLAMQAVETELTTALTRAGYQRANPGEAYDLSILWAWGMGEMKRYSSTANVPVYGQVGGGVQTHSGTIYSPTGGPPIMVQGTSYSPPQTAYLGTRQVQHTAFSRSSVLYVIAFDRSQDTKTQPKQQWHAMLGADGDMPDDEIGIARQLLAATWNWIGKTTPGTIEVSTAGKQLGKK